MIATLLQLAVVFVKFSFLAIGSSVTVVADMEREVVAHGWMTSGQFMAAYAVSQATPGPGTLVVIPIGYAAAGAAGAAVALLAFFGPTAALALVAARLWLNQRGAAWTQPLRAGLTPVVIGIIAAGAFSLAANTIHSLPAAAVGVLATLAILGTRVPTVFIILAAGLIGGLLLA